MKIYTRRGDGGETDLFGGKRVRKDALRVEAYGCVDELNAALGVVSSELQDEDLRGYLEVIQASLFDLGAELATPNAEDVAAKVRTGRRIASEDIDELETWTDRLEEELAPLVNFLLPGGARAAALLHLARTVCRKAERRAVSLAAQEKISPLLVRYLNRLSDLFFVMARSVNRRAGVSEAQWIGRTR